MDTEPRTTALNKEEVSALSTGEPIAAKPDLTTNTAADPPSHSGIGTEVVNNGATCRGGETVNSMRRTTDKGTAAHVTAVVTSTSKMITRRAKEITKRRLKKGERQRDKRGSGRDRKSRARAAALTDESESESKSDYECRSNDTFERAKLDDDAHYQVLHMPHVNDQALAADQEENEDAQEFAYGATQKD